MLHVAQGTNQTETPKAHSFYSELLGIIRNPLPHPLTHPPIGPPIGPLIGPLIGPQ